MKNLKKFNELYIKDVPGYGKVDSNLEINIKIPQRMINYMHQMNIKEENFNKLFYDYIEDKLHIGSVIEDNNFRCWCYENKDVIKRYL